MSLEIRGLTCASCKKDIPADGVTCTGCSAPHHWPCYSGAGHCASCQSAKPPMPFAVAVRPAPTATWAMTAGIMAALLFGIASLGLVYHAIHKQHPPALVMPPPPPPPGLYPPPPPPPGIPAPPHFAPPPPPPPQISQARRNRQENWRVIQVTIGARGTNGRATLQPGRMQGYLGDATMTGRNGEQLQMELQMPVRALFLNAEVRASAMPGPLAFRAEARVAKDWVAMGQHRVPPTGRRWFRLDADKPFDAVRITLEGDGATLAFTSFCGLLERPAGEVLDATRYATVKALEGGEVVLAGDAGATVKVPASLVPAHPNSGLAYASPNGTVVLRMTKDGNVSVFDARSAQMRSFGTHLLSLHSTRNVDFADDETDAWINGVGMWSLLDRWRPAAVKDAAFSAALETTAVLNDDGSVALYRPNSTSPSQAEFASVDELEAVAAGVVATDDPWTPERQRVQMKLQQLGIGSRKGQELTRSQGELLRFLREDAGPQFRKLVAKARPLAVGDRVGLGSHAYHGFGMGNSLQVTMLDKDAVMVRPMERGAQRVTEIELPRAFLPALPVPRVGQYIHVDWDSGR